MEGNKWMSMGSDTSAGNLSTRTAGLAGMIKRYKFFYIMLVPVIIWYIIFCYVPMYGVITSFQDYAMHKGVLNSPFVGLKHFYELFEDDLFWRAFKNSLIIAGYRMIFEFPVPIILAILINEIRHSWLNKTIQTIVYLPHFLSWVIVASIMLTIFNPDQGLVAALMKSFGGRLSDNLITARTFRGILIVTNIWKEAGWGMIIYIASIAGIDVNIYEAALVDGANRFQRMWHITLPGIRSVIIVMLILTTGSIIQTGFDQVFNLSNPLVMETGDIIDTYVYRTVMKDYRLSYAAAIGLFNSVICATLLFFTNWLARAFNQEGIY
jgi:putative aldouronate transport system permease protein